MVLAEASVGMESKSNVFVEVTPSVVEETGRSRPIATGAIPVREIDSPQTV